MVEGTIKVVFCLLLLLGVFLFGYNRGEKSVVRGEEVKTDTLYVCDTITQYEPIYEERIVLQKVQIPVVDTLRLRDTLYVYLEREQVVWQDSLSKVYASGIMPQIDSVHHYVTERVVTQTETILVNKKKRWGIGIHAGYGIGLDNNCMRMHPYVGVGVSYNIINW